MTLTSLIITATLMTTCQAQSATDLFFAKLHPKLVSEIPTLALDPPNQHVFPQQMLQKDCLNHALKWKSKILQPSLLKES